jgi:pimeloyl-ACP methyl ester carboxylesterase
MRRRALAYSVIAVSWAPACCPTPEAQEPAIVSQPVDPAVPAVPLPPPPPGAETLDEGNFVLSFKGQPAGRESFAVRKSDLLTIEHDSQITVDGTELSSRGTLTTGFDWKPRSASFKGRVAGTEVDATLVAGPPLTITTTTAGKKDTVPASRDVDYFFADNVMIHLTPLCGLPAEVATKYAFPGREVKVAAAAPVPEGAPIEGIVRRTLDLGGALSADVYCQGAKLLAVDAPQQSFLAARAGSEDLVAKVRRKERTKPPLAEGLVELERKVAVAAGKDIEAVTLSCSLVVPASHAEVKARAAKGPQAALPAVVFLTGSGKQDRDDDSYGPGGVKMALFKVLASELGKAGVASLRCDDRGSGGSTGNFTVATLQAFTADAVAATAALRSEPAVDPRRVGLIGHSEGGVVAPVVAAADRKIKAIALLAAPGRSIEILMLEQLEKSLERAGTPKDVTDAAMARFRTAFEAVRKGEPLAADVPEAQRKEWEEARPWLRSHMAHDTIATVRGLKRVPVLVAQGGKDQQVSTLDAEALKAALAKGGNKKVDYKLYAGLNHLFAPSETGSIAEYSDPAAVIDPAFIADVVAFAKKRL